MKRIVITFDKPQDYESFVGFVLADISEEKGTIVETQDEVQVHIKDIN